MRKKTRTWFYLVILLLAFFGNWDISTYAMGTTSGETEKKKEEEQDKTELVGSITGDILDEVDLTDVQGMVDMLLGLESFSISRAVEKVMRGESALSFSHVRELFLKGVFRRFYQEKGQLQKLLVLLIFSAVFTNLSAAFGQGHAGETGFYVVYLLVFTMLMKHFSALSLSLSETMGTVTGLLKTLAPAYFLVLTASTGVTTATLFYQGILLLIWMIQWILQNFLLPVSNLYILISLLNALSKEEMLSRMADLLKSVITWSMNTMLSVMLGLQVIRSVVTPIMDHLKRSIVGKTASALPGIGNAINSVTEVMLSCAVLVRNSLGVVFMILFLLIGVSPLIHYAFLTFSYRLLAAVTQPIADKRLLNILGTMGNGCALLLRLFLSMELMCILAFLILMISFGGNVG